MQNRRSLAALLGHAMSRRDVTRLVAGAAGAVAAAPRLTARATPLPGAARPSRLAAQEIDAPTFVDEPPENDEGTILLQFYGDTNALNPLLWDGAGGMSMELVFEALVSPNPQTGAWDPELAESWEVAEDGVTWTFHLREGVTWHDGTPFTSADVLYSYQVLLDPALGAFEQALLAANVASIEAPDDLTVVLTSTDVNSQFVSLAFDFVAPVHIWGDVAPGDVATHPGNTGEDLSLVIGTGPFRLVERVPQDHTTVERYDDYWGGRPHVQTVIAQYTPDLAGAEQLLRTGDHDWGWGTFQTADELNQLDNIRVYEFYSLDLVQFGFNLDPARTPFFPDLNVRKALLYGLDRDAIVEAHFRGYAAVANTVLLPQMATMNAEGITVPPYTYDPDRAAAMLDEAGWTIGADGVREQDGVKLAFTFADNEYFGGMMSVAQEFWRELGVDVEVQLITWEQVDEQVSTNDFDAAIVYLSVRGSGYDGMDLVLNSINYPAGGNYVMYENARVDELLEAIRAELDPAAQIPFYTELQNIYLEDLPYLPIAHDFDVRVVNNRVHNLFPNPYWTTYNAQSWWIDPQ